MLYMIGIGLGNEKDISVRALEIVKKCDFVYFEDYTSLLTDASINDLEKLYGKKIRVANRELVEKGEEIINEAITKDVAFLVAGDVFSATTHSDLFLRAKQKKVEVEVIFNAGVFNAIGLTGLQLYKFGKITSIVFPAENYFPTSCYDVLKINLKNKMHTLMLLDIKKDENKFMTITQAINLLLEMENRIKGKVFSENTFIVGCARLGGKDFVIKAGLARDILGYDFGKPPHCLIVPGELHFMEEEMLRLWK